MRATGADGGFRFAGLAAGRYQLARVLRHERFATFDLAHWVELGAGREEVRDLAPPAKFRLLGELRSLAAPSEATYVRAEPVGDPPGKARASRAAFVHEGSFVIDGLESGTWSLRATPLGRPGAGPGAERRIDVAPGTSDELRVVLEL